MLKKQPSVCAGDYSEEEIYEWMKQKASLLEQLKSARAHRELLQSELNSMDERISELTLAAALEYSTDYKVMTQQGVDERTARDVPVIIHLLRKPTGNKVKDAENAALADWYSAALKSGKIVGFISEDATFVQEVRRILGQIS